MTPERRKRINRLKKIILRIVILLIVLPVAGCVVLGIKLGKANGAVERLAERVILLERALQESVDEQDRERALRRTGLTVSPDVSGGASNEEPQETREEEPVPDVRKVYLTFDDGPSVYTGELLDILARYGVKATFFVTGKGKVHYADMYRRIVEEGHTLGMHSYSHEYRNIYASLEGFQNDIDELRELLYRETGVVSKFYRFPGGSSNSVTKTDVREFIDYLDAMGITYFDWNLSAGDATNVRITSDQIVSRVMNDLSSKRVAVVLMHDAANKRSTVEALPKLIEEIQALGDGTEILPITDETELVQHISVE